MNATVRADGHVVPTEPMAKSLAIVTAGAMHEPELVFRLLADVEDSGECLLPAMGSIAIALFEYLRAAVGDRALEILARIGLISVSVDEEIAAIAPD